MTEEELELEQDVEIPDNLEQILLFAIQEAKARFEEDAECSPFVASLVQDIVYFDSITGETPDEIYQKANDLITTLDGITGYAFCYDGWMDNEQTDAIIAEGGLPGNEEGVAIGCPYSKTNQGALEFLDEVLYLGTCPNYAQTLHAPDALVDSLSNDKGEA